MLQCPVCYETYDLSKHRPKITPCGHTFCVLCLKAYRTTCPTCRKPYSVDPDELTDNFLALQETTDLKFVTRRLWCHTCSAEPSKDCMETHDVCSARCARHKLEDSLSAAYLKLDEAVRQEMAMLDTMGELFNRMVLALEEKAQSEVPVRQGEDAVPDVKAGLEAIAAAEKQTAARLQDLSMLREAAEAQIKFRCGDRWHHYFLKDSEPDGAQGGNRDSHQPQNQAVATRGEALDADAKKSVLFVAYAMSRLRCPSLRVSTTQEVKLKVQCRSQPRTDWQDYIHDVVIELKHPSMYEWMFRNWTEDWKPDPACMFCMRSDPVKEKPFASLWTDDEMDDMGEETQGMLCVSRTSAKELTFYIVLCPHNIYDYGTSIKILGTVSKKIQTLNMHSFGTNDPEVDADELEEYKHLRIILKPPSSSSTAPL